MSEIPAGARTSEYYRTNNIPERFDNPGINLYEIII